MSAELPERLTAAIESLLEGRARKDIAERASKISLGYRGGAVSGHVVRDGDDALAYAVSRMPATYAAVREALDRLEERCPGFAPRSALDVGCGPGTASWAVADAYPDIAQIAQIDRNTSFLALARTLAEDAGHPALRAPRQVQADLMAPGFGAPRPTPPDGTPARADLVVLAYALAELPTPRLPGLLDTLWQGCSGAILIVEPGTPAGYARILLARDTLRAAGARLVAPCPHEAACPLIAPDWCHFSIRLPRSRDHRAAKSAMLSYEDEKFSYLVAVREPQFTPAEQARILDRPDTTKIGFAAKVCRVDGAAGVTTVAKRDKVRFAETRRFRWGDEMYES